MVFFLCFSLSVSAAKFKFIKKENPLDELSKSKEFKIHPKEEQIAEEVISFYKDIKKNHLNQYSLKKLKSKVKSKNLFIPFYSWLSDLESINSKNSSSEIISLCQKFQSHNQLESIKTALNEKTIFVCHRTALEQIQKEFLYQKKLSNKVKNYLYNYLEYFSSSSLDENLYSLIDKLSFNKDIHLSLSELITKKITQLNLEVDRKLLSRIHVGPELTYYIQMKGLDSYQTKVIFMNELDSMIDGFFIEKTIDVKNPTLRIQELLGFVARNEKYLSFEKAKDKLLSLGRSLSRSQYYSEARDVFYYVIGNSSGEQKNEAIFQSLWTFIKDKKYTQAHKFIIQYDLLTNFHHLDSRIKFWTAFSMMKNKDVSSSINYFTKLIKQHPISYYAIMATKKIQQIKDKKNNDQNFYIAQLKDAENDLILRESDFSLSAKQSLKRFKLWGSLDFRPFVQAEYEGLKNTPENDLLKDSRSPHKDSVKKALPLICARLLGNVNNYVLSFRILYRELARNSLSLSKNLLRELFPKPYLGKIRKIASEEIDPIILLSLIRQESAFNPEARSHVGATGLMQLMPSTARTIQKRVKHQHLKNPTTNLKLGSKYFEYLYNKYKGNLVYTLSAYNAGESRVTSWRKKYFLTDEMMNNIENIPFSETRNYVKLIFRNIFFYKLMHEELEIVDSTSTQRIYDIALQGLED